MEVDLGKDFIVQSRSVARDERNEGATLYVIGNGNARHLANGGKDVYVGDHRVDDLSATEGAGAAQEKHDPDTMIGEMALHAGKGDAMISRADDERVTGEAVAVEGIEDAADGSVEDAEGFAEACHVLADGGVVRQGQRRLEVAGIVLGVGFGKGAVGFKEADGEKKGTLVFFGQEGLDWISDIAGGAAIMLGDDNAFVADALIAGGFVLDARECGEITVAAQEGSEMTGVIGEAEAAMRKTKHAAGVCVASGEEGGAAGGAGGIRAKGLAKHDAFLGKTLEAR